MGGLLVGLCLALSLYGISVAQCYFYMMHCQGDGLLLRGSVLTIFILETLHTALLMNMAYVYAIESFGNFAGVLRINWSCGAIVFAEMAIVFIVQGFYVRRVWILSKRSKLLTGVLGVLFLTRIALGLVSAVNSYLAETWIDFRHTPKFSVAFNAADVSSVVLDLSLTILLIFELYRHTSGVKRTDGLVYSLIVYTVNTGAITTLVSIAILLSYMILDESLLYAGLIAMQSKLYANAFLGLLNTRLQRKAQLQVAATIELARRTVHGDEETGHSRQNKPIEIMEYSETSTTVDPSN
ncbi:unnamed protein product [Somion occarium]|uniref:DUF6534 domain-containing protein n=1 Tax=Somion occarium TaxID=3059160 RepID=A0ABP1CXR4_9APHY